jgi:hypothetical protein
VFNIVQSRRDGNLVTITTDAEHFLRIGYSVDVEGTNGNPSIEGTFAITSVPTSTSFTYVTPISGVITEAPDTGTVSFFNLFIRDSGGKFDKYCLGISLDGYAGRGVVSDPITATFSNAYGNLNTYTASAYVSVEDAYTFSVSIGVRYFTSSGTPTTALLLSSPVLIDPDKGWVRLSIVSSGTGVTGEYARVYIVQGATENYKQEILIDGVQFENSAEPTPFIEPLDQGQENTKVNNTLRQTPVPHITGMELSADIMLNGLLLNTVDENNIVWVCTDLEGWWTLPDSEVPDLTRGLDDGSYDVRGRYTAREMTLKGSALLPNRDLVPTARAKLIDAIALVHRGGWLYVDEDPTKAAFVRLSGKPDIEVVNPRGRIDFSIGLRAANPVKLEWNWNDVDGYESKFLYDSLLSIATNSGNIDTPVVLTIDAGSAALCDVFSITNTYNTQNLKIVKQLRGSAYSSDISSSSRTGKVTTLTSAGHKYLPGDVVTITGVTVSGRTDLNESAVKITETTANTITYNTAGAGGTLAALATNGTVGMDTGDVLEIDTYNRSATLNGDSTYARSFIDAQVDWITLGPGDNRLRIITSGVAPNVLAKYRSAWIG